MSAEANKEISRRWHEEVFNQRKLDAIDQFLDANYTNHSANIHGLAAAKETYTQLIEGAPDVQLRIDDLIAEGDKVVTRWTWLEGGKVASSGISIWRVANGKIAEDWFHSTAATEA